MKQKKNPLRGLQDFGQSVWLDFFDRTMIESGDLARLIEEDGLRGITTNPQIFHDAIANSSVYDQTIRQLAVTGKNAAEIYEAVTVEDVRLAADLLRPVFDDSGGRHGFVSLEVNPHLARDAAATIEEAGRLWNRVDRPNIFIKVPGTREGLTAIEELTREGLNINVTLLFSLSRYREVVLAYIAGMKQRAAASLPLDNHSVASFFLSRIDTIVDHRLEQVAGEGGERGEKAAVLLGRIGVAGAKQAYRIYQETLKNDDFQSLARQGCRPQLLLWASTGTKNPQYSQIKYVEPLIGPDTVNTMPLQTMDAYREQGRPAARIAEGVEEARRHLQGLQELGIDLDSITRQLENEGIEKFNKPYDATLHSLERKIATVVNKATP